jgi:outer membrane receptor protein involved in Fe transport
VPVRILTLAAVLLGLAAPAALAQTPGRPGGAPGGLPANFGGTVTGVVVDDATGEALPSATAALYTARDSAFVTGAAADLDGAFRVESVPPGQYQVRVSFVGYGTLRLRGVAVAAGQTTALDTLRLTADDATLGAAEVVGERDFVEQRADRTVYNVEAQAVTTGGSALETLATLPAIEVDTEGSVSLRGNQNVVIQINGRPVPLRGSQLASLLRQIPASRVARVEVLPNPSARYDPDGMSGIVNIVLVEGTDRGLSGGLTFGGGSLPNAELGGNLSYQAGPWDVYSSYGYRYDESDLIGSSLREIPALGLTTNQALTNGRNGQNHFVSLSATYTLSPQSSLAFEGSGGTRFGTSDNQTFYTNTLGAGAETETARLSDSDFGGLNLDGALVYRRSFDAAPTPTAAGAPAGGGGGGGMRGMMGGGGGGGNRGGGGGSRATGTHELAVEARVSRNADDDDNLLTDQFLAPTGTSALSRAASDQTNNEAYLQADYARPLGGVRLETGVKALQRSLSADLDYSIGQGGGFVNDPTRTNAFTYDEGVYAAYVQGSREFGNVALQAGLRAEAATRDFTLRGDVPALPPVLGVDLTATSQSYQSLFPSAFATYSFGPGTLFKASYSRRIERPRSRQLSPFPSFDDTLNVRVGNPGLRPEYTDAYELTMQYRYFLTLTPFFRHTTDVVRQRFLVDPVTGITTQTAQNLDTQDSYGADLTLLASLLGGRVRGFVSGSASRTVVDGGSVETGLASNAMSYSARTSLQFRVRQGTDLQLFGFYRAPQDSEDGRTSGFGFASLGISQKISNALQLSARVNDLFSTSRFEFTSTANNVRLTGIRDPQIQQVSATLTYTFGTGQPRRTPQQEQGGTEGGFGL